ncbi:nitrogenase component 1 [Mogibacterium pumilum]|uniref:Nitrogenase/oxidoreductase component 1 domain-containing protein n=1 Tax=Mogibacterium pumilum TaxID=86332 RepID=A0A223ATJ5_9FIRM|nr:nitrogenase component 1 [Mogibacterium pumilum]ASS38290.1 hypothetical protein AXF17_07700 [Mogibacterium pumilum]
MKQVARVLSTYSADLFGICSVLYELGGLVVMHDASGCNSTYNTHDEPRWYDIESMIYISGLIENDVILGNDEKLISDVIEAASETQPKFIAISAALIPLFMSTDMKGIARIIEKRTGIPTFGFTTNAMDTYVLGGNMVYREFLGRFCPNLESIPTSPEENSLSVNLLGVTPLDFSIVGNVEALRDYFKEHGIEINCCMTMGCTVEEMANAHKADVNIVCSSLAIDGARVLQDKYGTPAVLGIPMGKSASFDLEQLIRKSAVDGKSRILGSTEELYSIPSLEHAKSSYTLRDRARGGIWIVSEVLNAAGIRYTLEHDLGLDEVHILCPTQVDARALRDGDVMVRDEADIENVLKGADCVIADPIYRRILTRDENGNLPHFINMPHEAYSGRMYRSHIPIFTGVDFTEWLAGKIDAADEHIDINDIMKTNKPYKKFI